MKWVYEWPGGLIYGIVTAYAALVALICLCEVLKMI